MTKLSLIHLLLNGALLAMPYNWGSIAFAEIQGIQPTSIIRIGLHRACIALKEHEECLNMNGLNRSAGVSIVDGANEISLRVTRYFDVVTLIKVDSVATLLLAACGWIVMRFRLRRAMGWWSLATMVLCSIPVTLNALAVSSYLAALKGIPTSRGSCLGSSGVMIMVGLSCSIIEVMIAVATVLCNTSNSAGIHHDDQVEALHLDCSAERNTILLDKKSEHNG
ncbi:hypothetical protein CABS01_16992 [Colletotrichum abscissum]|uniref:Integral membrane protein n=1 Tax=Colletotrichum godetiae TaxID=1209918 RepID=A0AAJ0EN32_9PEZI|nr:uncharacterized protein CABS01_16992 [Colletotrichum abscissum]XP_060421916.1 uncharacterized protein BDP55DRAFT_638991 [Colletotrichum godetiae]KAK1500717.1 hypothetical protein CABS01_16992 [Colletotrichum abscissum]KAK1657152.1 hypothetical protein BDP55DRAFT_638991 [Colletotrichum godetiae]